MVFLKVLSAICAIGLGILIRHSFYKKLEEIRASQDNRLRTATIVFCFVAAATCLFFAVKAIATIAAR